MNRTNFRFGMGIAPIFALVAVALLLCLPATGLAQDKVPDSVAEIFENKCAFSGCHVGNSATTDLDLTAGNAFDELVNRRSLDFEKVFLVKPGNYRQSYLFLKLIGAPGIKGDRMPPRGDQPLSKQELKTIAGWINALPKETKVPERRRRSGPSFSGLSTGSMQTAQTVHKGSFSYRIAHRWLGRIDSGFGQFFGLDAGGHVLTEFSFPLSNRFTFTLGRSGSNATLVFNTKLKIIDGATTPFALALIGGLDWVTAMQISDPNDPTQLLSRANAERFTWYGQVAVEKQISRRISVLLNPGILLNGNVTNPNDDALFSLGLAGRFGLSRRVSLFVEIAPVLAGANTALPVGGTKIRNGQPVIYDSFTVGFEHSTGGHVFHLYATNSLGLTPSQVMSGGNLDFLNGEMRLGFNIYRSMRLPW